MRKDWDDRNEWLPIADTNAYGPAAIIKLSSQQQAAIKQGMGS